MLFEIANVNMRKDYLETSDSMVSETDFVEQNWTKIWEQGGDPQGRVERIVQQDEYRLMRKHLEKLSGDARILNGGCGLGDWVLALTDWGIK